MNRARHGATILEATAALMLLGAIAAGMGHALRLTARQQQTAQRQTIAQIEAANLADRVAAMRFDDVMPDRLAGLSLSAEARAALPDAELKFDVATRPTPTFCKRVAVEVGWQGQSDARSRVRFTVWRFPTEGGP